MSCIYTNNNNIYVCEIHQNLNKLKKIDDDDDEKTIMNEMIALSSLSFLNIDEFSVCVCVYTYHEYHDIFFVLCFYHGPIFE